MHGYFTKRGWVIGVLGAALLSTSALAESKLRIFAGGEVSYPLKKYDFNKALPGLGDQERQLGFGLTIHQVAARGFQSRTTLQVYRSSGAMLASLGFGGDLLFGGSFYFGPGVSLAYAYAYAAMDAPAAYAQKDNGWLWAPRFTIGVQISHNHRVSISCERMFTFKSDGLLTAFENYQASLTWTQRY